MSEYSAAISERSLRIGSWWRASLLLLCLLGVSGCLVQMPLEQEETPENQALVINLSVSRLLQSGSSTMTPS